MGNCLLLWLGLFAALGQTGEVKTCDFKGYSTFKLADFVQAAVINKVKPTYPEEGRGRGLAGRVYVRILIDEKGNVERVCADLDMSSTSEKRLIKAAENAAKQWTFKPNFGFPKVPKTLKGRYLEDTLAFDFKPRGDRKQR
jgi:TonB family protein